MIDWYKKAVFKNYANFSGRARRSEFWYFILCNFTITFLLYALLFALLAIAGNIEEERNRSIMALFSVLAWGIIPLYSLAVFIPNLAVFVRRLHDTGKSGWTLLVYFIPLVGLILLIIWLASDSQPGSNNWGPNPKDLNDSINQIGSTGI
ncbi:DUF805 domain-containing protein [Empedobacter brevis]|uniref:DUF805 domain-containing protein n=1 Tax=Empedobacter brevis TaxID=247 RepID=UPI002FE31AC0